jgi:SpoVK/Ycf46/Vps4 family AAA+-type ATPase
MPLNGPEARRSLFAQQFDRLSTKDPGIAALVLANRIGASEEDHDWTGGLIRLGKKDRALAEALIQKEPHEIRAALLAYREGTLDLASLGERFATFKGEPPVSPAVSDAPAAQSNFVAHIPEPGQGPAALEKRLSELRVRLREIRDTRDGYLQKAQEPGRAPQAKERLLTLATRLEGEERELQAELSVVGSALAMATKPIPVAAHRVAASAQVGGPQVPQGDIVVNLNHGDSAVTRRYSPIAADGPRPVGMETLLDFVARQQEAISTAGQEFGLDPPKGILVTGVPGVGKSMAAKAVAQQLKLPLYQIQASDIGGAFVGQSEQNISAILEAFRDKRCVLWLDEGDKFLGGDHGTDEKVRAVLLTAMENNQSNYFYITANDPEKLPPELVRSGRLDAIFFAGLPEERERAEILASMLQHKAVPLAKADLSAVAKATAGFSGAELGATVQRGLTAAFRDGRRPLQIADLLEGAKGIRPSAVTHAAVHTARYDWAREVDAILVGSARSDAIMPKRGFVTEVPVTQGTRHLGGFEAFKSYVTSRAGLLSPEARARGIPLPKGALLVGVPGCGKTLAAQATAEILGRPLLKLSLSNLLQGNVFENMKRALQEIRDAKNVVLLLDELEKMLELRHRAPEAAADLLAFLNDQSSAFILGTANDLSKLPPEYTRRGRWDDAFFVDLPSQTERVEIFRALLSQRPEAGFLVSDAELVSLAAASAQFTGSELGVVLTNAQIRAFNDQQRAPNAADVRAELEVMIPDAIGKAQSINEMRAAAAEFARRAGDGKRLGEAPRPQMGFVHTTAA